MEDIWKIFGGYLVDIWGYLVDIWWTFGGYLVDIWGIFGGYLVDIWWMEVLMRDLTKMEMKSPL